ncbi:MAG TPA: transketolase [Gemmatimonadales bacterium]|nr:transketolase [Gemmatimonadales bacterium]
MTATARSVFAADALDQLCINTIRALAVDAVERANSGHPGAPMALAPLAWLLFSRHLRHSPLHPRWMDRDRFVLSNGHASMLLYATLFLSGYDLSLDDLKQFRQWDSRTPGHPESHLTPGVETTTGPLGQGFANAVGMAIAEAHLAARFNRPGHEIVDHRVYGICGDGDLMEGLSHEAASLAGHLRLGKLIFFYDDNHISIDGPTELAFSEDVARRFEAYGWHVERVADGNDLAALHAAALKAERDERPSLVIVRTHIGFGAPNKQDTAAAHGAPLGRDEVAAAKRAWGWEAEEPFHVPAEALEHARRCVQRGEILHQQWLERFEAYRSAHPEAAAELEAQLKGELPRGWTDALPAFGPGDSMATRAASGKVLAAIVPRVPSLLGGSADLSESNLTYVKGTQVLRAGHFDGRYIHFGVREHAMGAVMNGMALHGGLRPYGGTFLVFSDYMRPAIRLAALMGLPVIYVFTHDSIGLGEDGPTHQPIEHLAALRAIPHLITVRPADAAETAMAWRLALERDHGPTALVLTRQKVPAFDRSVLAPASGLLRGGYVLVEATGGEARVALIGSGSEVALCVAARDILQAEGVPARVVSMPSPELFATQDRGYRDSVLPPGLYARVAVEAARPFGWHQWVGDRGTVVGLDRFGASAPYERIYQELGLTAERVAAAARELLG